MSDWRGDRTTRPPNRVSISTALGVSARLAVLTVQVESASRRSACNGGHSTSATQFIGSHRCVRRRIERHRLLPAARSWGPPCHRTAAFRSPAFRERASACTRQIASEFRSPPCCRPTRTFSRIAPAWPCSVPPEPRSGIDWITSMMPGILRFRSRRTTLTWRRTRGMGHDRNQHARRLHVLGETRRAVALAVLSCGAPGPYRSA